MSDRETGREELRRRWDLGAEPSSIEVPLRRRTLAEKLDRIGYTPAEGDPLEWAVNRVAALMSILDVLAKPTAKA